MKKRFLVFIPLLMALAIPAAIWATQTSPVSSGASERSANQSDAQLMNDMDRQLKDIGALPPGLAECTSTQWRLRTLI